MKVCKTVSTGGAQSGGCSADPESQSSGLTGVGSVAVAGEVQTGARIS